MYQDNPSEMLLETNGRGSSTMWTKHIWNWYYMIKYQVAVGDVTLKYCPTEIIMADHFTKPPQGIII